MRVSRKSFCSMNEVENCICNMYARAENEMNSLAFRVKLNTNINNNSNIIVFIKMKISNEELLKKTNLHRD